jgi:hypothetical protein
MGRRLASPDATAAPQCSLLHWAPRQAVRIRSTLLRTGILGRRRAVLRDPDTSRAVLYPRGFVGRVLVLGRSSTDRTSD